MAIDNVAESWHESIDGGVARDPSRVGEDLLPPNEASVLAQVDHALEDAAEDRDPKALPDSCEARGVGQCLVEGVAERVSGR